jgi:hypothetical protein
MKGFSKTLDSFLKSVENKIRERKTTKGGFQKDEHVDYASCKAPNVREWLKTT